MTFLKKNLLHKINHFITYMILFFPAILAMGSVVVNLIQILISLHGFLVYFKSKYKSKLFLYILLILFFYSFFITFINQNYYYIKNSFVFLKIILFIISFNYLFQNKYLTIDKILKFFNIILIIFLFDTFYQYIFEKNILGFEIEPNNKIRLTSFFKDEYVVGGFLFRLFYPIVIFQIFFFKKEKKKFIFHILAFCLLNLAIILSGERASVIFIFIFFILSFIFFSKYRKLIFYCNLVIILFFSLVLLSSNKLQNRFMEQTFNKTLRLSSDYNVKQKFFDNQYMSIYFTSYYIWQKNIIFGNGLRSYKFYACNNNHDLISKVKEYSNHAIFICSTHPHNFVLELLVDLGILGLFFWIVFLILIIKEINRMKDKNSFFHVLFGLNVMVIFWPLLVHGSMFSSWNSSFFIFSIAVFFSNHKLIKD